MEQRRGLLAPNVKPLPARGKGRQAGPQPKTNLPFIIAQWPGNEQKNV